MMIIEMKFPILQGEKIEILHTHMQCCVHGPVQNIEACKALCWYRHEFLFPEYPRSFVSRRSENDNIYLRVKSNGFPGHFYHFKYWGPCRIESFYPQLGVLSVYFGDCMNGVSSRFYFFISIRRSKDVTFHLGEQKFIIFESHLYKILEWNEWWKEKWNLVPHFLN